MDIKEKLKLYNEERKLLKIKKVNDFLDLDDDLVKEYFSIITKNDTAAGLSVLSSLTFLMHLFEFYYTIRIDNNLREDLIDLFKYGIDPVIDDFNDPLYRYLIIMTIVSYIATKKSLEFFYNTNKSKMLYEEKEPKLKGYKYIKI